MIERGIRGVLEGAEADEVEVIVVCNGCTDDTAARARRVGPAVMVVELSEPSKTTALNVGDELATRYPRVYMDADVEVGIDSLRCVVDRLGETGCDCAAPRPSFYVQGRPWSIRSFYRVWQQLPYLNDEAVGSGLYALSRAGRARFGVFPPLVADDQFVMQHFAPGERATVTTASFVVHTPGTVADLIRVRTRVYRGNHELARERVTPESPTGGRLLGLLRLAVRSPRLLPAVTVYATINGVATIRARRRHALGTPTGWERDNSSRTAPSTPVVAYLVSLYPAVSHTFILREVRSVRAAGLDVQTFSVRRPEDADLLSADERSEAATTWSIRPRPASEIVGALTRLAVRHPLALLGMTRLALRESTPGLRSHVWQLLYVLQAVLLQAECRRRGIRHIHVHLANVAADVAWLASDLGSRLDGAGTWRWTLSVHGPAEFADVRGSKLAAKVAAAALVLCITDFTRSQLMALLDPREWSKLHVVHMGVDLSRYPMHERRSSRPDGPFRILCVGRLDPVKGQSILVEAVAALLARGRSCRLLVVGSGPGEDYLRRAVARFDIESEVELLGAVGQGELPELYRQADVFCLPSFAEGLPVVLMEAMASGLPVVSTTIAGIPELIRSGQNGLLVSPGRADLLAEALASIMDDHAGSREMAAAARQTIESGFDATTCGAQVAGSLLSLR